MKTVWNKFVNRRLWNTEILYMKEKKNILLPSFFFWNSNNIPFTLWKIEINQWIRNKFYVHSSSRVLFKAGILLKNF